MINWESKTVRDLIQEKIIEKPLDGNHGGIHPKGNDFVSKGIPFITASDVKNGSVDIEECKFITLKQANSLRKGFAKTGDVLLTHKASLGRTAIVPKLNTDFIVLTPQVTYYRVKNDTKLNNQYLKYYFDSTGFQNRFNSFGDAGSTRAYVGISEQLNLPIVIPPIEEQKSIAKILSSLDDKIKINRQMNATLEAMARALFKAWFVDFEPVRANSENRQSESASPEIAKLFPSEFENGIPKGWQEKSLDEIANFLNGLALQKFPPESEDEFLSVIKIAQLRKGNTEGSDKASANLAREYVVYDGDVLFSWSGTLEVEIWCGGAGALNQHLFKVTSSKYPKWFYFLWTRFHLLNFREIAAHKATTMGHIQRYHLKQAKVLIPDTNLLLAMNGIFEPLINKYISNLLENRSLSQLRDALLPKLLSGQISVAEL